MEKKKEVEYMNKLVDLLCEEAVDKLNDGDLETALEITNTIAVIGVSFYKDA